MFQSFMTTKLCACQISCDRSSEDSIQHFYEPLTANCRLHPDRMRDKIPGDHPLRGLIRAKAGNSRWAAAFTPHIARPDTFSDSPKAEIRNPVG
jgi:hypothetical protein